MVSWDELRLFVESYEVIQLSLSLQPDGRWCLMAHGRRVGDSWSSEEAVAYSELGRAEALDVACAELLRYLEL